MEKSLFLKKKMLRKRALAVGAVLAITLVSACTQARHEVGINDPNEAANRRVHKMNIAVDRAVLKPLSNAVSGKSKGGALSRGVGNFASNISLPSTILNDFLQANIADGFSNTFRFAMNTTIGLGGLFDVATPNGLAQKRTDFGETLYVWGVPEGHYVELPFAGPSTQRAVVGSVVDFFIDPMNYLLPAPQKYVGTAAKLASKVGDRGRFSDTIDSILYESEDSYAQTRLLYLQSRRQKLYGGLMEEDLEDPYAE